VVGAAPMRPSCDHVPMSIVVTELPEVGITVLSRWVFNCYVVHDGGEGRPVIVDPGLPSTTRAALAMRGDRSDRVVVVATHGHADHVGGLTVPAAATAELSLPVRIRDYLHGETPRSPGLREVARIRPALSDQPRCLRSLLEVVRTGRHVGYDGSGARFPVRPAHWLTDGEPLAGASEWQVLHTPGHTDDSTSLWNPRTGVLLSGDSVLSSGGLAWFTPELVDRSLAAATEERLRPLPVTHLLPGHGRPVVGARVMDHALGPADRPPRARRR
jgi:glyoxylase-like metal-dependent hydrolase (beta-lactamase superfamily II)